MAVRTIQQIQKELSATDRPAVQALKKQQAALPKQLKGIEAGLKAQQQEAFGNILTGAKSRGLKFSGIPLDEQARYTSTTFLPALAQARFDVQSQQNQLQGAIADIIRERGLQSQSLRQQELDREEAARQAAASRAAAAASNNYQDIIRQLREKITSLSSPQQQSLNQSLPMGASRQFLQAQGDPNRYLDPITGQTFVSPFLNTNPGQQVYAQNVDGQVVYTGGY